jgi:hypothetical protein
MNLQVTGIRKRGGHYNPHERIEALCGPGWTKTEAAVIADIKAKINRYYVSSGGRTAWLVAATHSGREYLKTEADGYSPDNLLSLPDC